MKVAGCMVPAEKAITVSPWDSISTVMDLMLEHNIGAVVVVRLEESREGSELATFHRACGIITKTDVIAAYKNTYIGIDYPCHHIMSSHLATCTPQMSRDQAARIMELHKNHHAIVVDDEQRFVGVLSSWDITAECARDHRAWPWNRSEDGKFHNIHGDGKNNITTATDHDPQADQKPDPAPTEANPQIGIPPSDPLADPTSPTSPTSIRKSLQGSLPGFPLHGRLGFGRVGCDVSAH